MTISLLHAGLITLYGFVGLIASDVAFETVPPKSKLAWWVNGILITSLWPIILFARLAYYFIRKTGSQ